ncbi:MULTISPECIES: intradiol ring-cleavage dioxygenase [Ramlibacter]|uniref:Intradiol ring-cleavage dioxygenase n=1 Tax=Ramlibacter aquaticus TaxID=2780094 RepID=A0ABR9SFE9_9BURK|nr:MULTISPECIES: intradiol ring-cleavage dioxygenase [Ramlibacter]MBE7941081.1 intradiol ring-cleavage dioxygenase [Ramlibacter aquaticus]
MHTMSPEDITRAALASVEATPDARLKEIMGSLVRHLHAFASEVKLTEAEWFQGIDFLTRCGHITDDKRQEFILLSDVLGLSMLTVALNNDKPAGCTEATVFGPFHVEGAPHYPLGADIANGAPGTPCAVHGSVRGLDGRPVPGAVLDVWQSDAEGLYDVQRPGLDHAQARGVLTADGDGRFHFRSILPVPYCIPHDGPVGRMLEATGRHPWRPAHLHFRVQAPGYETLITHVFAAGGEYLDSDVVFGVRRSLVCEWKPQADGSWRLDFDFVLNPVQAGAGGAGGGA